MTDAAGRLHDFIIYPQPDQTDREVLRACIIHYLPTAGESRGKRGCFGR